MTRPSRSEVQLKALEAKIPEQISRQLSQALLKTRERESKFWSFLQSRFRPGDPPPGSMRQTPSPICLPLSRPPLRREQRPTDWENPRMKFRSGLIDLSLAAIPLIAIAIPAWVHGPGHEGRVDETTLIAARDRVLRTLLLRRPRARRLCPKEAGMRSPKPGPSPSLRGTTLLP